MAKKIICTGYGNGHRFTDGTVEAAGRLWFVCQKCRWSSRPVTVEGAPLYRPGYKNINGDPVTVPAK